MPAYLINLLFSGLWQSRKKTLFSHIESRSQVRSRQIRHLAEEMCICTDTHAHFHTMHKRCLPCFAGRRLSVGMGLPAAGLWAEGRLESMMWRDSMLTANAPVTGQPHSKAQQHLRWCPTKWCLYSSGSVSVGVSPCVAESIQCVSSSVCTCACVMDSEQTLSVTGAASQLIRCGRCSYHVLQQLLLTPPSIFPKWQAECLNLVTDERADVGSGAVLAVIVPFHTWFHLFAHHLLGVKWRIWFGQLFCLQRFICNFDTLRQNSRFSFAAQPKGANYYQINAASSSLLY